MRKIFAVVMTLALTLSTVCAHSGRTDSSGGHKDNKNRSGLGSYHYHCGGYPAHLHNDGYCPYTDVFPKSVSIKADKKTLKLGESTDIFATVSPSNACDTDVYWENSNSDVVTFRNGVLTAVGYGTAVLSAETFNGKVGKVTITVKEVTPQRVDIQESPEHLYVNDTHDLSCVITPADVDNPAIVWSSSNEEVASVSQDGKLQAVGVGNVTISATASNGVRGLLNLVVKEKLVESINIPENDMVIHFCDAEHIQALITPADATYPDVTWSSSDESVIRIDETGLATATGTGTAIVTATSHNGLSDSVFIKVDEVFADRIEILGEESLYIGSSMELGVDFFPANTSIKDIEWTSSDDSILTVDTAGVLHAKDLGTALITATQKSVSTSKEIEVLPIPVEYIELTIQASDDGSIQFAAEVYPENATFPEVIWSSSNSLAGKIDEDGLFTPGLFGKTTIAATTKDGVTATHDIDIDASAGGVALLIGSSGGLAAAGYKVYKKRKET